MPTVYVVNDSGHDFGAATKYGELLILSQGLICKTNITSMYRQFAPIRTSLSNDFILACGPSVMFSVACSMFSVRHGMLNILIWCVDGRGGGHYVPRRINLKGM
jgi:hypothetical protein